MYTYILRRVINSVPVLIGITIIGFAVLSAAPGDPLLARIDPEMLVQLGPEWLEQRRAQLGLDKPLPIRYARWLQDLARGNLGYSVVTRESMADQLALRLPATLQLMGAAMLFGLVVGVPFGLIAAIKQYSILDYVLTGFTMAMISIPSFFLGLLAIYVFGVWLRLLPTSGMYTLGVPPTFVDRLEHLILPASILGFLNAARLVRYTRASMLEVLHRDYMRTARAKGLRESVVFIRHGFRNALLPVITVTGLLLPQLVAGAIITEQIFAWPGMGQLAVRAASDRDPSVLMSVILIVGLGVMLSNLLVDILYAIADPRIRYGSR